MKDYPYSQNAKDVLARIEEMIKAGGSYDLRMKQANGETVFANLSVFDWWVNRLTQTHLKQMRTFLKAAIKHGYTGYVCFKVGASGCANGMWAHKNETTTGYSPDGDCLYRSFSPDYTYYSAQIDNKFYPESSNYNCCKTMKQLDQFLKNYCLQ